MNRARILRGFISPWVRPSQREAKSTWPEQRATSAPKRVTTQKVWKETFPILTTGLQMIAAIIRAMVIEKVSSESSIKRRVRLYASAAGAVLFSKTRKRLENYEKQDKGNNIGIKYIKKEHKL